MTQRTALVVANEADPDPGFVGDRLRAHGLELRTALREGGELPQMGPDEPDLVVLLGSAWSVHAPEDPQALASESRLVRSAVDQGVPLLGLCYGAQVMAHALGGRVWQAPTPEVGLIEVDTDDPALVPSGPWSTFHVDTLQPPPDAQVLARNGCGVQAFVLPTALGVQFHPEVRPEVFSDWVTRLPEIVTAAGVDPAEVVRRSAAREDASRVAAATLVDRFLERCAPQLLSASTSSP